MTQTEERKGPRNKYLKKNHTGCGSIATDAIFSSWIKKKETWREKKLISEHWEAMSSPTQEGVQFQQIKFQFPTG